MYMLFWRERIAGLLQSDLSALVGYIALPLLLAVLLPIALWARRSRRAKKEAEGISPAA